jgi:hypothetical protein
MPPKPEPAVDPLFRFRPWPWPGDPIVEWVLPYLNDPPVAVDLAKVQLQLMHDSLNAQMKAVKAAQEILGRVKA